MKIRLFALVLVILFGCSKKKEPYVSDIIEAKLFETNDIIMATKKLFTDSNYFVNFTSGLRYKDTLLTYYANRKFEPVWAVAFTNDSIANIFFKTIKNSKYEGLDPAYYRLDSIIKLQQSLHTIRGEDLFLALAKLELLVSDNMVGFHKDRVSGRADPRIVFGNNYQLSQREYPDFKLFEVLNPRAYRDVLIRNTHQEEQYVKLTELLRTYYDRVDTGENWFTIDTIGIQKLEPGDTINIMPQIAKKLYLMGVIKASEISVADSTYYNKSFAPLVRRFQQSYGLYDDAIFGRKTFGLLNASLQDRIDQITANLERIRWFQLPEEKPYITVNLPAFELDVWWPDSVKKMRVCIGKPRDHDYDKKYAIFLKEQKYWLKPRDFETPQISSAVAYMVINPTWTVPRSIITREMFHQMQRDKSYLKKNGYGVFYKGKELKSDSIDWKKYTATTVPFDIVQEAGEANALGKIKFIFPNPFHIYLHDTPQKSKFKWSDRAVSHGCVRVEDPLLMGEFLMQNNEKFKVDDYRIWMGYAPLDPERLEKYDPLDSMATVKKFTKTNLVRLHKSMPVYFLYNTIWFDDDGKVQYRNDVYDKNKYIISAMNF